MTKFQLFKKLYVEPLLPIGGRVTIFTLYSILDNSDLVNEAISKLYIECPTKFPGENKNVKHYLLKTPWRILDHLYSMYSMSKTHPDKTIKYIWRCIKDICKEYKKYRYYMDPNKI